MAIRHLTLYALICFFVSFELAHADTSVEGLQQENTILKEKIAELERQLELKFQDGNSGKFGEANATTTKTEPIACPSPANPFAGISAEEISMIGQTFFLPLLSKLSHVDEEVRKYTGIDKTPPLDSYWTAGLGVDMLSVPRSTPNFDEVAFDRLRDLGIVAITSAIPAKQCKPAAKRAIELIKGDASHQFSEIMENMWRKDMPLDLSNELLREILYDAVEVAAGPLRRLLGDNATLVEYSTMTSFPGAKLQSMHPDAGMEQPQDNQQWSKLVSCYLYLADVTEDMAALDVWPGTHTHVHFLPHMPWLDDERHENAVRVPAIRAAVPAGTMVLFDSRTYHRGSANTSPRPRPTLYFSMMGSSGALPEGPTFTLKPKYKGKITLEQLLRRDVHERQFAERGEEELQERRFQENLKKCHASIESACAAHMQEPNACHRCAIAIYEGETEDEGSEEEVDLEGCETNHYIERVCKVGIFADSK